MGLHKWWMGDNRIKRRADMGHSLALLFTARLRRRSHLRLIQRYLRPRYIPRWQGNHLTSYRRNEGQGRQRRVFVRGLHHHDTRKRGQRTDLFAICYQTIRRHVGCSRRRCPMQGNWHHRPTHQATCNRWYRHQDPRTWCSVCSTSSSPCWNENWPNRGALQLRSSLTCLQLLWAF